MKRKKHRLALLISGSGTTMEAIIKASQSGSLPIEIACIISSTQASEGIQKAKKLGIPTSKIIIIDPANYKENGYINQKNFGLKLLDTLKKTKATVVTQNGWLPLTPGNVIKEFKNNIFNQHPGPVPAFGGKGMYGRRVHAAVLLFRRLTGYDFWTEIISQRVAEDFDSGTVVKSRKIEILANDTVDSLSKRCLPLEHELQIEMLRDFVSAKLKEQKRSFAVKDGEEKLLEQARKIAIMLYPNG